MGAFMFRHYMGVLIAIDVWYIVLIFASNGVLYMRMRPITFDLAIHESFS